MPGYQKQRAAWFDYPSTATPIQAVQVNGWDQAVYELKQLTTGNPDGLVGSTQAQLHTAKAFLNPPGGGLNNTGIYSQITAKGTATVSDATYGLHAAVSDNASVVNKTITNAVNNGSGLIRITCTGHTFATSDKIAVYAVGGTTEANGAWTITVIDANTFDLQGSAFVHAYTSGGTATNRPMITGVQVDVAPALSRGGLTGTAAAGDDVTGVAVSNTSGASSAKGAEAFYVSNNTLITGSEWFAAFNSDADSDIGYRLGGTIASYGIDLQPATFTGSAPAIRLPNNVGVWARNAANNADLQIFFLDTSNQLEFPQTIYSLNSTILQGSVQIVDNANVAIGTTNGTKFGTATGQKLGFWNVTPVIQPATTGTATGFTANTGTAVNDASTFTGGTGTKAYRISDIVLALKQAGIMAAS